MEHSHTKASMPQFKRMFLVPLSRKVPWQQHLNYEIHIICSKRSATVHKAVSHACVRISKWKFSVMFLDVFRDMTLKGKPPPYIFLGGPTQRTFWSDLVCLFQTNPANRWSQGKMWAKFTQLLSIDGCDEFSSLSHHACVYKYRLLILCNQVSYSRCQSCSAIR